MAQTALVLPLERAALVVAETVKPPQQVTEMLVLVQQTLAAVEAGIRGRKPHPSLEVLALAAPA